MINVVTIIQKIQTLKEKTGLVSVYVSLKSEITFIPPHTDGRPLHCCRNPSWFLFIFLFSKFMTRTFTRDGNSKKLSQSALIHPTFPAIINDAHEYIHP